MVVKIQTENLKYKKVKAKLYGFNTFKTLTNYRSLTFKIKFKKSYQILFNK